MIEFKDGKTIVTSNTPKNPYLNRAQRRASMKTSLLSEIHDLRKQIKVAGIKLPKMPKFSSRKILSGHMSRLVISVGKA